MSFSIDAPASLTGRSAADFRAVLIAALAEHMAVELNLDALEEADLSFVQLALAARAHAAREALGFRLSRPAGPLVAALLERAGFLTEAGPSDIDFWFHGELPQ